jgi:hypothetical protein
MRSHHTLPDFATVANAALLDLVFEPWPLQRDVQVRHAIYEFARELRGLCLTTPWLGASTMVSLALDAADPKGRLLCRADGRGVFGDLNSNQVHSALWALASAAANHPGDYLAYGDSVWLGAPSRAALGRIIGREARNGSS